MDFKAMGLRLKKSRKNSGITQEILAERLDVSVEYLSRVENGNVRPSFTLMEKICSELQMSEEEFIFGKRDEKDKEFCLEFQRLSDEKKKAVIGIMRIIAEM